MNAIRMIALHVFVVLLFLPAGRGISTDGAADAALRQAYDCYFGRGVDKDWEKAAALFEKAAGTGSAEAKYCLARCYSQGIGVKEDGARAEKLMNEAAAEYPYAMYMVGERCIEKEPARTLELWTKAAELGNTEAQYALQRWYFFPNMHHGPIVLDEDIEASFAWNLRAAEGGFIPAMQNAANAYMKGEGCLPDYEKAVFWFTAAAKTEPDAMFEKLGDVYRFTRGDMTDSLKSARWSSYSSLGDLYAEGIGVEKDLKEALACYVKSLEGNRYPAREKQKIKDIEKLLKNEKVTVRPKVGMEQFADDAEFAVLDFSSSDDAFEILFEFRNKGKDTYDSIGMTVALRDEQGTIINATAEPAMPSRVEGGYTTHVLMRIATSGYSLC